MKTGMIFVIFLSFFCQSAATGAPRVVLVNFIEGTGELNKNFILATTKSKSEIDCGGKCVIQSGCKSFAFSDTTCDMFGDDSGVFQAPHNDECESTPCQNGGTCTDAVNSYTCACTSGYYGTDCTAACPGNYRFEVAAGEHICYRVEHQTFLDYPSAQIACQADGGHIMRVDNMDTWKILNTTLNGYQCPQYAAWIEGSDADSEGEWVDLDGAPLTWYFWHTSFPKTSATSNCLIMDNMGTIDYKFIDNPCNAEFCYVCRIDI